MDDLDKIKLGQIIKDSIEDSKLLEKMLKKQYRRTKVLQDIEKKYWEREYFRINKDLKA